MVNVADVFTSCFENSKARRWHIWSARPKTLKCQVCSDSSCIVIGRVITEKLPAEVCAVKRRKYPICHRCHCRVSFLFVGSPKLDVTTLDLQKVWNDCSLKVNFQVTATKKQNSRSRFQAHTLKAHIKLLCGIYGWKYSSTQKHEASELDLHNLRSC